MNPRITAILALLSLGAAQDGPGGHWRLDGDARDAAGPRHATLAGRTQFIESPLGDGGQLLALNGVDAGMEIPEPPLDGDFTLSFWFMALELRAGTLARRGWSIELAQDGSLRLGAAATPAGRVATGQWYHAALSVAGKSFTLYLTGEPAARGELPRGEGALTLGKGAKFFAGLLDDVRIDPAALSKEDVRSLAARGARWLLPKPADPFPGRFELRENDVVAFAGGEDMRAHQEDGRLESFLARPSVRFRSFAWEGDTVYEQWRILNFGPWERHFERVGASVIVAQFGQAEALQGKAGLGRFKAAYEKLLERFAARTRRIVLLSPTPFEKAAPPLPDLSPRNDDLRLYVDAVRSLAEARGVLFVDLFTPLRECRALTRDGLHLDEGGLQVAAREVARSLGLKAEAPEAVRKAVTEKNRLWAEHWRPTNWAFLYGDRMEQPSSRHHEDRNVRWFPVEIQRYLGLIHRKEAGIDRLLKGASE